MTLVVAGLECAGGGKAGIVLVLLRRAQGRQEGVRFVCGWYIYTTVRMEAIRSQRATNLMVNGQVVKGSDRPQPRSEQAQQPYLEVVLSTKC